MAAIEAIADFQDKAAFKMLVNAASDSDPEVRLAALRALDGIDDPQVQQAITNARKDPDDDVRMLARLLDYSDTDSEEDDDED